MKREGIGSKLLLAAGSLAVGLAAAEILLRIFVGAPPRGNLTPVPPAILVRTDLPDLPFMLRRGARGKHVFPSNPRGAFDPDASLTYEINSLGFRGPETTVRKPEGVFRVVGLGDSFTFGTGVRAEETFLAELARRQQSLGTSRRFEVLNLGVMGYDTPNEAALLQHAGLAYEPDLVVVCFFLNDAQAGATHSLFNVPTARGGLARLARHSFLFDRIAFTLERRRQTQELTRSYLDSFAPAAPGWIAARRALEEIAETARREDFELVLMIFPVLWDLSGGYPFVGIHETVAAFAESLGIPVLDLLPAFAGFDGPELWVHPTNQHPNEIAHAIAGDALFEFLKQRAILPVEPREAEPDAS